MSAQIFLLLDSSCEINPTFGDLQRFTGEFSFCLKPLTLLVLSVPNFNYTGWHKSSTGWGWRIVQKDTAAACVLPSPRPLLGPCSPVNSPHYPAIYTKRNPHLWTYVVVFKWKWYEHHYMRPQLLQSLPRITGDNGNPVIHTYTTERGKLENPKSDRHKT